jgi:hypothetical protein
MHIVAPKAFSVPVSWDLRRSPVCPQEVTNYLSTKKGKKKSGTGPASQVRAEWADAMLLQEKQE